MACATGHPWLWDLSVGLYRDQWCNWITTNIELYHPLLLLNSILAIVNCGISDDMQTVSKLTNSRNNFTNTNHVGSYTRLLRSYCRTATFLSRGSTRAVIPPCTACLGTGGRFHAGDVGASVIPSGPGSTCVASALGTQRGLFSFWCFCLALQIGDLQGFGMNFPKLDLPQLGLVSVLLASYWPLSQFLFCLAMTLPRHRWCWQTLPTCCGFHLTAQLVSSYVTPLILKLHFTHLSLLVFMRTSPQHLYEHVYAVTGDPQMGDGICISVATGLHPWRGKNVFPLAATDASLILGALKLNFCVIKAMAEKHLL